MEQSLTPAARASMRQAIAEAGGNEVFFLGRTDRERRVVEAEALARGSAEAVPAILQLCRYGDVVLHNQPSGRLQPSGADIEIASRLGALGVGFYIVNNNVERIYRVVEAFAPKEKQSLDPAAVAAILGPQGIVATTLPGYEERPEQLRMAFAASEAFNAGKLAVIEAGTGTGKSLAYLVPAILWAINNEERVVVSTNTINLQEQLIRKDIPFLQRAAKLDFRAVLVKGRANYFCRRRAETARHEPGLFEAEHALELAALLAWAEKSNDGSREELPTAPREEIWDEVCCELDQCSRVRCPHYGRCFFHKARRQAAQADLLVVNHSLLLADLALRQQTDNYSAAAVLPPFDRIVLDEAHHLEDVATRFFATQTTRFTFGRVLGRLRHPRKSERGLLPRLQELLAKELPETEDTLYRALYGRIEELLALRQALLDRAVADLDSVGFDLTAVLGRSASPQEELRHRILPAFAASPEWGAIAARVRDLGRESTRLASGLRELLKACAAVPEEAADKLVSALTDLRGIASRLEGIGGDLAFFAALEAGTCAWLEVAHGRIGRGNGLVVRLCTAPLEVAASLKSAVYDRYRTVVMTSATLAVDGNFDYFRHRVGLDASEPGRVTELLLDSPFDFARQTLLAIPANIPEPGAPGYAEAVSELCERAIVAADGRTFVLFTAYSLLRRVHAELAPGLQARGYHCLRQGDESRHRLLKHFAADPTSVLFATDSFWEGVDVPGRALEQVIITRLPFKVPTEPVLEARAEAIETAGGDPFRAYTIPQAVLRFKQGFGRLIRHRDDRGVVLILDSRVVKKGYGRIFLRSLPPAPVVSGDSNEVLAAIRTFFTPVGKKT